MGLGAILVQQQADGNFKPVIYASRSLTDVERRYCQTEKEALSVVWACERFRYYLLGIEFQLITDHKPLEVIYSPKSKPPLRIERWALRLQPFNFKVKYEPGKTNAADALSRLPLSNTKSNNIAEDYVYFVSKSATPIAMTTREIEKESGKDDELREVRKAVRTGNWSSIPNFQHVKGEITTIGCLSLRGQRIIIPTTLRKRILDLAHEGHQGIVKCKNRLRQKVWWPGIDKEIENRVKRCKACIVMSETNRPEPLKPTPLPDRPWQHIGIDLCGPLPSGESLLVAVDYYSRWFEVGILHSTNSNKVINCLDNWFTAHGLPEMMITDNGVQFTSQEFSNFCSINSIMHRKITPYSPQANGEVERQNRTIMKAIKTVHAEGGDWRRGLNTFLKAYRSTPHSVTNVSPAEMMYGRKLRTKLPEFSLESLFADDEVRLRDYKFKEKGKEYFDKKNHVKEEQVKEGDIIYLKQKRENKLSPNFSNEPYKVIEKKGNSLQVENTAGVQKRRNIVHMKKVPFENEKCKTDYWNQTKEGEISDFSEDESGESQENMTKNNDIHVHNPVVAPGRPTRIRKPPKYLDDYVV